MEAVFDQVLTEIEAVFRELEPLVPPPSKIKKGSGFALRFLERTPQQACLLKFARQISGLRAIKLLANSGFHQELGAVQRMVDEIFEDIVFIAIGLNNDELTERHIRFLQYFWSETEDNVGSIQRKHIRAFINGHDGICDPSTANNAGKLLYRSYSGYVHASSSNVMEMIYGIPPRFHLGGMLESPFRSGHLRDLWNYYYRGLLGTVYMASAFQNQRIFDRQMSSVKRFEAQFGYIVMPS